MSGPETSTDAENDHRDLHSFWWLYLPILFFCCRYAIALFTNATTGVESWFRDEHGIVENLTVLLLVGALFCTQCDRSLRQITRSGVQVFSRCLLPWLYLFRWRRGQLGATLVWMGDR